MNIQAGRAKGRKLKTLPGEATRPTQGKVRAALFSILTAWVPGGSWVDLYAGSGAVGLEAASRGASRVVLVENAGPAVAVIRENQASTRLEGIEVFAGDVLPTLARFAGQRFDVVFMDPPYSIDPAPVLEAIEAGALIGPHGRVVVEHRFDRLMPAAVGRLDLVRTARYADACLSLYAWRADA